MILYLYLFLAVTGYGQVGINTASPNAQLDIRSSNQLAPSNTDGILIPKIDAFPVVSPTAAQQGMLVYLTTASGTDLPGFYYWDNITNDWILISNNAKGWNITGNSGTNPATNFIGTLDNQSFMLKTNNRQRALFSGAGNFFLGSDIPVTDNWSDLSKAVIGSNDADNDLTLRSSGTDIPVFNIVRSNGTMKSPSVFNSGEAGSLRFWRYTGVGGFDGYNAAGRVVSVVTALGTALHLSGGIASAIIIKDNGAVGIGVSDPQERLHVSGRIRMSDGTEGAGKILTSDANGTASWISPIGLANGTLDQAYDFGGAGNGRVIMADSGAVTINGNDGFVASSPVGAGVGALAPSGAGPRMVWNPRRRAFRAGYVTGNHWDDVNIGDYSVSFGVSTIASGENSTAFGSSTTASGTNSASLGRITLASGDYSIAFGHHTVASGTNSTVFGMRNSAKSYAETVLGIGSTDYTPSVNGVTQFRTANATDRLLVVGNAIDINNNGNVDDSERRDALVILKNGNTGIGSSTPQETLHVVGKIRMADGSQGAGKVLTCDANGTAVWNTLSATNAWGLGGNIGTTPTINFIGTSDNNSVAFRTNNIERARILATGQIGIGTTLPTRKLHINENTTSTTNGQLYLEQSGTGDVLMHIGNTGARHFNFGLDTSADNFKIGTSATAATAATTGTLLTIQPTGEVGIGTIAPQEKLHVSGPAGLTTIRIANTSTAGTTSNVALDFFRQGNANTDWRIYNVGPNLTVGNSGDDLANMNDLYQYQGVRFIPMNDATQSLGQAANRWNTLFASNGTINTSDAREKKNIQNLNYGLPALMQLRPVRFEWKKDDGSGIKLGLIAQELQQVIPEVVRDWDWEEDEQGNRRKVTSPILGVYYSDLIPVLIKATQEQQSVIEQQKQQIDLLKQQLQEQYKLLLERIERIEKDK